jgi:general secretion pathway protein D
MEQEVRPAHRRCCSGPRGSGVGESGWDRGASPWARSSGLLVAVLICTGIAGCAGGRAFSEGNTLLSVGKSEEGLAKLEEAVKLEPRNAEYRIALASRRAGVVNRLVASGEASRRDAQLPDAEVAYRRAQTIDPGNAMAKQGLDAIATELRHRQMLTHAEALVAKGEPSDLADALERIRPVLSENPGNKQALGIKAQVEALRSKTAKPEARLGASYKKAVTLEFRDAPLRSVFDFISKVSGLNVFFDKDIKPDQKATVIARNTTIEDAVRLLLVTNQLERKVLNENSILIYPNTPQKLKDYQALSVRTFYLTNADVKSVSNSIKTIVKTKDMVIDERLGMIILRDTPEAIRVAERIVALQDLSDPEVLLEVEVMEIKRSRLLELGVQWPSQLALTPLQLAGVPLTLADLRDLSKATIQASTGSMLINARKEDQDANILANPRIRVRNKEKAKILIGDRVPIITTTSTSTGFISESVNYVDVGLKLEVEPTIYLDQEVAIRINLEVSSLVNQVTSKGGSLSYQIGTRGATTVLRLKDGETQILAGLINDEDRSSANKVPGVGELPVLGRLFGSQNDNSLRGEILLSITPRVVRSIRRVELGEAEFEAGTEANIGAEPLRLRDAGIGDAGSSRPGRAPPFSQLAVASVVSQAPAHTRPTMAENKPPERPGAGDPPAIEPAVPLPVAFAWRVPSQVKVGEQFNVVLGVDSQAPLKVMPLVIAYDPQLLEVLAVEEGDFFKQSGGATAFNSRVDRQRGEITVMTGRQSTPAGEAGTSGAGSVVTVNFKALRPSDPAAAGARPALRLVSAVAEPRATASVIPPQLPALSVAP